MKVDPKARQKEREENGWGEGGGERTPMLTVATTIAVAAVVGFERFESPQKRTPGLKVRFVVLDGEHAGKCVDRDYWLTENALGQLADLALAKGHEEPFDPEDDDDIAKAIMGKAVEIKTKTRRYNDKDGNEKVAADVDFTNKCKRRAKDQAEKKLWSGVLKTAQEQFQGYLDWRADHPRGEGGGGGSGEDRSSGGAASSADDDVPFARLDDGFDRLLS